jgi:hypothetical protein
MLKETGYQEKIEMLKGWLPEIIEIVKKDLRNEHLKSDKAFCRRYFLGKNPAQVQADELAPAYAEEIASGNTGLGEFISTRWLLKNTDIYGFFEARIKTLTADFETLETLPYDFSNSLLEEAVKQFGPKRTYLFSVLNSVVFPKELYQKLQALAQEETRMMAEAILKHEEAMTLEAMQKRHERELVALRDRFEKKFSGLERKYLNDVQALKKQIQILQKKLEEQV